MGSKVLNL